MHRLAQLIRDATLGRETRLSALVESSPLAAAIVDPDGRPFHANAAWQALWPDLPADSLLRRVPELAPWCRAAAAGESCVTPALVLPATDGIPERWVRAYVFPVRREGATIEVGIVLEEVTAQRRAEDALRDAQRRESLGTLAGGIAHDFNNLLTGILGNASLALRALPDSDQVGELLREVIRSAERGAELTQQLLAYAGKGRIRLAPVDLPALVRDLEGRVRESLPSDISVSYTLASDCPPIEADAGQIRQLLLSLIANAAEAIGATGGSITIAVAPMELASGDGPTEFGGFEIAAGTYVRVDVRDSGMGMDRPTQARVFEPFFSTKFLGRGLGLAAALGIARSHRGAISVRSLPGSGSTFSVVLPAAAADTGSSALRTRPSGEQILVVDPEPAVRRSTAAMLEEHGFTVATSGSGPEAVARVAESAGILLAIVDLAMPGMGAAETVRAIRRVRPGMPVLLTTHVRQPGHALRFGEDAVTGVVAKPFTAHDLATRVTSALRSASR